MYIDWSRVAESGVLIIPAAVASAYIGARIKAHLDRARPETAVTACRIGTLPDLMGSTVTINQALSKELERSPWTKKRLTGEVNAASLLKQVERLEKVITDAKSTAGFIEDKLTELVELDDGTKTDKLAFLDSLFREETAIIDAAFTGGLVRGEFLLPVPPDDQLNPEAKVAEFTKDEGPEGRGYLVDLGTKYYRVCSQYRWADPKLLPAVKAICWFHLPSLEMILLNAKKDVSNLAISGDKLLQSLKQALKTSIPLIVEVSIVNRGRSSVTFTPWGMLRLVSDGHIPPLDIPLGRATAYWQPEDPVLALKQQELLMELEEIPKNESRLFTVESGKSLHVRYRSVDPISVLEDKFPHIGKLLAMDMFKCVVLLRRADESVASWQWVKSSVGVFGARGDSFPMQELDTARKQADARMGILGILSRLKK